jgi:hypothetical protein
MLPLLTTLAPTIVSAARELVSDIGSKAVYAKGDSNFSQALAKTQIDPDTLDKLQSEDELAAPNAMQLASLLQASQQPAGDPQLSGAAQALQASLQAGGQQTLQASRVSLNMTF